MSPEIRKPEPIPSKNNAKSFSVSFGGPEKIGKELELMLPPLGGVFTTSGVVFPTGGVLIPPSDVVLGPDGVVLATGGVVVLET